MREAVPAPTDAERAVQLRLARLGTPLYRPVQRAAIMSVGTAGLVLLAGLSLLILGVPPRAVVVVSLGALVAGLAIAWSFLLRRSIRSATQLVLGHDRFEAKAFERVTGGPMPCGMKAWTRWLAEHPEDPNGFPMLVGLGRLDEAQRLVDGLTRTTDQDRFSDAQARATLALARGETPDLALLDERLRMLRQPLDIQHRSACIAIVRASMAVDRGESPTPILVAAAERVGTLGTVGEWILSLVRLATPALLAFMVVSIVAMSRVP